MLLFRLELTSRFACLLLMLALAIGCDNQDANDNDASASDGGGNVANGNEAVDFVDPDAAVVTSDSVDEVVGEWWAADRRLRLIITRREGEDGAHSNVDGALGTAGLAIELIHEEQFALEFDVVSEGRDEGTAMIRLEGMPLYRTQPEGRVDSATFPGTDPAPELVGTYAEALPSQATASDRRRLVFHARQGGLTGRVIEVTGRRTTRRIEGTYLLNLSHGSDPTDWTGSTVHFRWQRPVSVMAARDGRLTFAIGETHARLGFVPIDALGPREPATLTLGEPEGEYRCIAPVGSGEVARPLHAMAETFDARGNPHDPVEVPLIGTFERHAAGDRYRQTLTLREDGAFTTEQVIGESNSVGAGTYRLMPSLGPSSGVDLVLWTVQDYTFEVRDADTLRLKPRTPTEEQSFSLKGDRMRIGATEYRPATDDELGGSVERQLGPADPGVRGDLTGVWVEVRSVLPLPTLTMFPDGRYRQRHGTITSNGRLAIDPEQTRARWYRAIDLARQE